MFYRMYLISMQKVGLDDLKNHLLNALQQYWLGNMEAISKLPISQKEFPAVDGALKLKLITLPVWASQYGVEGKIAVPIEACSSIDCISWENVDWWLAAFLMLECWHERAWEITHGSIHSYSFRLTGWDERVWEHAWVNRIAFFLRAWAIHRSSKSIGQLFHSLPEREILMTHDVDAVSKTISIRLKQSVFNCFNALRSLARNDFKKAGEYLGKTIKVLFFNEDWWMLDNMVDQERKAGIRSCFNFYSDRRRKSVKRYLFDPHYDIGSPKINDFIKSICSEGWSIGLHSSFDSWNNSLLIKEQVKHLEESTGIAIKVCRQHWLRFSWNYTWSAQQEAGIELDTTLMFNDRPGFRSAAAIEWQPWNSSTKSIQSVKVLPTIFMDSHFYDYQLQNEVALKNWFAPWFEEISHVHGKGAVLWHPHTISADYGWQAGYAQLLSEMKGSTSAFS